jgi:hypothetical protein
MGEESQPKKPRRVPTNFPHQIPKSKVPKTTQENLQERTVKITTKNNREQLNKALRNHAESSIHATKVHTRSSLPPDHPTHSTRSHHVKDRYGEPERGGSEWEPIKILLEGDGNSYKMNAASNTRL